MTKAATAWTRELTRWGAGLRQGVEGVYGKLHRTFWLRLVRPHTLTGFLAAKVALSNSCIPLNGTFGGHRLTFADPLAWA